MAEINTKLALIPLGGLGEIGKNMLAIKYGNNIILIDSGMMFPEDDLLGVDYVIPDITYLIENRQHLRAIFLTHGHEDHIGALPYVLRELDIPVYGTRLTLGIVQSKLKEHGLTSAKLITIKPKDILNIGPFKIEPIRVSHSVPDAVAYAIHTPVGIIVHTGDFKIDLTPVDGEAIDFNKFSELGEQGVLVLMSDSTNVERPGYTMSEKTVGATFDENFQNAKERIIVATFASNVHRLQQAITAAHKNNRKVAVVGRSMINVVGIAQDLGYLKIPENTLVDIDEAAKLPKHKVVILTTGSQGEPMSALTRIAMSEHRKVVLSQGDTVIISASPIPGNEKLVARIINQLFKLGAEVIYESLLGIHVSGHASQEELKLMLTLIKPKYFIPVHGEYRMLVKHAKLAQSLGMSNKNIFVTENGQVIEITKRKASFGGRVTSGRVLVDGLGVGDVGSVVLRDRKQLSQDGIMIVMLSIEKETGQILSGPDVVSRGFVYVRESERLLEEARAHAINTLNKFSLENYSEWPSLKNTLRDSLGKFLYEKTRRRPIILPIIMEI